MKAGILTFHYIPNIGAALQAYALCKFLRNNGVDCEIIDYRCDALDKREIQFKQSGNAIYDLIWKVLLKPKHEKKIDGCQSFIANGKILSDIRYTHETICDAVNRYDVIISGSDMIWDLDITGRDFAYYADFDSNSIIKIAYASSGVESWKQEDYEKISTLLEDYYRIGVREQKTMEILKENMGIDSTVVCDPVMLLKSDEWEKMAVLPKYQDYVLVYFPYEKILKAARQYAHNNGKELIVIENSISPKGYRKAWPLSPEEWLGYIINAEAVFTDSYHGLIFSLLFDKKVWTNNTGERQRTLINRLEIPECFLSESLSTVIDKIPGRDVNHKIRNFREESGRFILKALEDK